MGRTTKPGVRRDHGKLRHFDYQKPLRKDSRNRGAYSARRKRLGADSESVSPAVRRQAAGVKAARTRLINETVRRIKEARRTHFPAADYAANVVYESMFLTDVAGILEDVL